MCGVPPHVVLYRCQNWESGKFQTSVVSLSQLVSPSVALPAELVWLFLLHCGFLQKGDIYCHIYVTFLTFVTFVICHISTFSSFAVQTLLKCYEVVLIDDGWSTYLILMIKMIVLYPHLVMMCWCLGRDNRNLYGIIQSKLRRYCQAQFQLASLLTSWTELALNLVIITPTHPGEYRCGLK